MRRIALVVALVITLVGTPMRGAQTTDALAMLRAALGGDAALAAVQTIRARGTIAVKPYDDHFDIAVALPDRFVSIGRSLRWSDASWSTGWVDVPGNWPQRFEPVLVGGGESASEHVMGFNRETPLPTPSWYQIEKHRDQVAPWLDRARARLAEFLLPLMGGTPASYPVVARSEAYAISFSAVGGRQWRLELDPNTHLPASMTWTYPLSRDASPAAKPQQMRTEFSDFRVVGGLRWPHRLITLRDGKPIENATVKRYDVNVKLSDKMFRK